MSFHRVTWNEKYRFVTLHNYGCTFRCPFCSYKLKSGPEGIPGLSSPKPERFLPVPELKAALRSVSPLKVFFMGGEPTVAPELPELLEFAKVELGAITRLGHTNGSLLPLPHLDGANIGFKAWREELHQQLTGKPKELIYGNFQKAFEAGLDLAANMIYIPGLVEEEEFEGLTRFLRGLSRRIPFHIMGYIPVPGQPWRQPTAGEMERVTALCRRNLDTVNSSHLSSAEALDLSARDDRFRVRVIAGND